MPLEGNLDEKKTELGLNKTSDGLAQAKASMERTNKLISQGEKKCNDYLKTIVRPDEE